MTELLTAIGTLGIAMIGVGILLQIVRVEEAPGWIGRGVAALLLTIFALCIVKGVWIQVIVPWFSAAFASLTALTERFVITMLAAIALLTVGRIVLRRCGRHQPLRRDPLTGDGYEIYDPKDEND